MSAIIINWQLSTDTFPMVSLIFFVLLQDD